MDGALFDRYVKVFGRQPDQVVPLAGGVDVLFFDPRPADDRTYVVTAGISQRAQRSLPERFELTWAIEGACDEQDRTAASGALLELAERAFGGEIQLGHGRTVGRVALPRFTSMSSALLRNDELAVFLDDVLRPALADLDPPRELLSIVPLFAAEVARVERFGMHGEDVGDALGRIRRDDPHRQPFAGPAPSRADAPTDQPTDGVVDRQWNELHAIFRAEQPLDFDDLVAASGATPARIAALEKECGVELPEELRRQLARFDGNAPFFEYTGLPVARIEEWRANLLGMLARGELGERGDQGSGDGRVRDVPYDGAWIPFAQDGGGNLLCIDLAPGPHGVRGQVIQREIHGGGAFQRATSLGAFLRAYRDELSRSKPGS